MQKQKKDENNLLREIPPELSLLSNLRELILQNNFLSGTIPTELFQISQLERLDFSNNFLEKSIPTEIGQLSDVMTAFGAGNNALTGSVPIELFLSMANTLDFLSLGQNEFDNWNIPTEIGLLTRLTNLYLPQASITGTIPDEIGNCNSLEGLALGDNSGLGGTVPSSIGRMSNLKGIGLRLGFFGLEGEWRHR